MESVISVVGWSIVFFIVFFAVFAYTERRYGKHAKDWVFIASMVIWLIVAALYDHFR